MHTQNRLDLQLLAIILALTGAFLTLNLASGASRTGLGPGSGGPQEVQTATAPPPSPSPTPTITPSPTPQLTVRRYFPLMFSDRPPDVELLDAWTSNPAGGVQQAFLPGDGMQFHSRGRVNIDSNLEAHLSWTESGPCGAGLIFSDTVSLGPLWENILTETAPECVGIYSSTIRLEYESLVYDQNIKYVVNDQDSAIQLSVGHGFDRCSLPDIDTMQTWLEDSPYSVFNLYLGGISFGCKNDLVDAVWVYQTSLQGWAYTLTWVGPQAPCTNFTHRMSSDPEVAYTQGRAEAGDANAAAISLGFQADKVIYYDLEGYPNATQRCRNAVHEFMRGWVERLHELGTGAGGYGGGCSSYISEWAEIQPPPDDVWIAHWYKDQYDPDASVWNAPCVSDDFWADSQRTKQYAGGHRETWGSDGLTIDSNKFEGKTVVIPGGLSAEGNREKATLEISGPALQTAGLISPGQGWVVAEERLYWTEDGGTQWKEITPAQIAEANIAAAKYGGGRILGAAFSDEHRGWVVASAAPQPVENSNSLPGIIVMRTDDGGITWQSNQLSAFTPEEAQSVDAAFLEIVEADTAWLVLKLQSGSSFSQGRLFVTQDGGVGWEERSAPAGEPVKFVDADRGWMVSGPAGEALYQTLDGGWTWQKQQIALPNQDSVITSLPWFDSDRTGWLPALSGRGSGEKVVFFTSRNGGETWSLEREPTPEPGEFREALLEANPGMLEAAQGSHLSQLELPDGAYWIDFAGEQYGWAAVRSGDCQGEATPGPDSSRKHCVLRQMLLTTSDGGLTWNPVCSPEVQCFEGLTPTGAGE